MFGTFVICLPSPHEGGWVKLQHAGETKAFRTDLSNPSYACWWVLWVSFPSDLSIRVLTYSGILMSFTKLLHLPRAIALSSRSTSPRTHKAHARPQK
jgi:hypothetical protein